MKIVEIREKTVPIASPIRNACIDFEGRPDPRNAGPVGMSDRDAR
jgi:hypothetical protein